MSVSDFLSKSDEAVRRPPNRKYGLMGLLAIIPSSAIVYFFISSDDFDGLTAGSYGEYAVMTFYVCLLATMILFSLAELQSPGEVERIARLRRLAFVTQIFSFIAFQINFIGLIISG